MVNFKEKSELIWNIADLLRGDYKRSDFGKVILPMTVLRRLDAVLAPSKDRVLEALPRTKTLTSDNAKDLMLNKIAGYNFHNHSKFNFEKLVADPNSVAGNLRNYINGFSSNAREIIEYFNFDDQIDRMDDPKSDILFQIVKKFSEINFDGIDSMEMGYIFEDLIRRFAEQSNETAGEHFTPREVIELMVNLLFNTDKEIFKEGIVKTLYDPACGTGGMLSMGEKHLKKLNADAKLELFGQEINPESYAICKSDMLIKGDNPSNIKFGNTFTVDGLREEKFDYMLSNPPFGVDWKKAAKTIKAEHENLGYGGRFGAGLPRINDGSLLFLQHMISKMKHDDGSRIAVVFNGSPLFTGQAESGESNIRKWIIENDWLEAIIALPDQLFYNTGISTYIWIVNNKKEDERKGHVQLINATGSKDEELMEEGAREFNRFWEKMGRSLGNKRKIIPEGDDARGVNYISKLYGEYRESEFVKILPNDYFGYWRITVEQPERDKDGAIRNPSKPKADKSLRDTENIPFLREDSEGNLVPQTIEEYFEREVVPHVPDAWIDEKKTKIGYEINFTKYFYAFKPLRSLDVIRTDILALEESSLALEKKVLL
ncbi:MAG: type I restriction-modification system subunit M [Epsilonproteobacteria bacterium]|nr:type I restriction-modification system subunit M [Campylobacterota bacterium]